MGWRVPLVEGKGKEGKDGTGFLLHDWDRLSLLDGKT